MIPTQTILPEKLIKELKSIYPDYEFDQQSTKENFQGLENSKDKRNDKLQKADISKINPENIEEKEDLPALAMTLVKTEEMRKKIIIRETGNPNEFTVLIYGEKTTAGAVRLGGNSNTYGELLVQTNEDGNFTIKSKNIAAAQGNAQFIQTDNGIVKASKGEIKKEAIDSLLYQMAEGMKLNALAGNNPLSGMVLNNYGSAHNFFSNDNRQFIQVKAEALEEIKNNWAKYYPQVKELIGKNDKILECFEKSFPPTQSPRMGFINRALNGFGPISISVNKKLEIQSITDRVNQAKEHLQNDSIPNKNSKIIEKCIESLEQYKSQKEKIANAGWSSTFDLKSWQRFFSGILEAFDASRKKRKTNSELHFAAIDMVLSAQINSLEIGGCQSAKDRYGAVRITAQAYKSYIEKYNELPPAFGTQEFKNLNNEKQKYLKEQFAKAWLSGIGQEIAARNTEGATGLKNNTQILTLEHQSTIREEIVKQLKEQLQKEANYQKMTAEEQSNLIEKLNNYQKTGKKYPAAEISNINPKLTYFEAFDPNTSNKLSNLNKFDEKEVKAFVDRITPKKDEEASSFTRTSSLNSSFEANDKDKPLSINMHVPNQSLSSSYKIVPTNDPENDPEKNFKTTGYK